MCSLDIVGSAEAQTVQVRERLAHRGDRDLVLSGEYSLRRQKFPVLIEAHSDLVNNIPYNLHIIMITSQVGVPGVDVFTGCLYLWVF